MNIVEKLIKIDLHIHSDKSFEKDGELVSGGTLYNIGKILVPALEKSKVNMAAITDHNAFSFEYYNELKKYSNNGGNLLKVLPGIELDVEIEESNKDTHAIAVFDDSDQEKVKQIEIFVEQKTKEICIRDGVSKQQLLFKPSDVIDLFRQIDLNFVLIVHQKADPSNQDINQEHNIADLGIEKFNELVSYDYFDAVEFKNYKVEGFLVAHKNQFNKQYNALCGSDCHEWSNYPKHDANENVSFNHCYINALPTFKGLAMALTGDNRVFFSHADIREPYLKNIKFSINGVEHSINLSSGLNVLIGDNSIGKSFFLEMLNNPELDKDVVNDSTFSKKLSGYKNFKAKQRFEILSNTLEGDIENVDFHRQGHIRSLFEGDNKSIEDQPFLSGYFGTIDTRVQKTQIEKVIDDFILFSSAISNFQKQKNKADNLTFSFKPKLNTATFNLSPLVDKDNLAIKDYQPIINNLSLSKSYISVVLNNCLLDDVDVEKLKTTTTLIEELIGKYELKHKLEKIRESFYSIVVEKMNKTTTNILNKSTDKDQKVTLYKKEKSDFVEVVSHYFDATIRRRRNSFILPELITVSEIKKPYDKYQFISKVKKGIITTDDLHKMLLSPIKNCDNFDSIKECGFDVIANKLNAETSRLPYGTSSEKYKQACISYAETNWLQKEKGSIVDKDSSKISGNSAGLNAQYYLDLYTLLERKKLFIIDQPEDDVSEARISKELKAIMRRMAQREQILFVTHNAELVVNLDVDNVIVFKTDNNNNLSIKNGALEYEDDEINILNEVAELLDGGAEVIRKRWKRYEKN